MGSRVAFRVPVVTLPRHRFFQCLLHIPNHIGIGILIHCDPGCSMGNKQGANARFNAASPHFLGNKTGYVNKITSAPSSNCDPLDGSIAPCLISLHSSSNVHLPLNLYRFPA